MDMATFTRKMDTDGLVIFADVIDASLTQQLNSDCVKWVKICEGYQIAAGINASGDGTGHHSLGASDSIDDYLAQHLLHDYIDHYFQHQVYILHACNPIAGVPKKMNYVHNIHRDARTFIPDYHFRLNMIVMLDDFTIENGATQVLLGSHRNPTAPDEAFFNTQHVPLLGKAGSVVLFNSYLWHRAGLNISDKNRVALTLSFGPAYIKPQMDYARMLGEQYGARLSPLTRQVLGYNARVPCSLDEWYRTADARLYHANQG